METMTLAASSPSMPAAGASGPEIAARHAAVFTRPPAAVPTIFMADGPLLGNGDLGVVLAGPPEAQVFHIGKNDFWRKTEPTVLTVGAVTLAIPALEGAGYLQEQDMANAEVRGTFDTDAATLHTRSWVDANSNLLVMELLWEGAHPLDLSLLLTPGEPGPGAPAGKLDANLGEAWFTHQAAAAPGEREVAVVSRLLGASPRCEAGALALTLHPGAQVFIASAVMTDLDAEDCLAAAQALVRGLSPDGMEGLKARHREWWSAFWARSFIEIPDKEIEKRWYAGLYILGSCSRPGKVAPGLWGNWITTNRSRWAGDYHLNYNFQAPYYIVYSANHADLSLPFYQAILESVPEGRAMAARKGWKGIAFPVCIGPWGLRPTTLDRDLGQRSNAAFSALNFIWHYQYTQDLDFLRDTAYPYLLEVADFWEDYLRLEEGRYVIHDDSVHEKSGPDFNPLLSLGLLRTLFKNLAAMSVDLAVDADRRARWLDILERLSAFPLQERDGKTVFRYSERGMAWNDGNTLGIQHIFPAGAIGLDSDPATLQIARDTIDAMARWTDFNGFSSWYTACARVGYDPETILARMRDECDTHSFPNLLLYYGGGGIENCSGPLAINEMLLQSHEGVIRLFPAWPRDQPARFGHLRAVGAFLVSAELSHGVVTRVTLLSEKGRDCTVQNPWPGRRVLLMRDGAGPEIHSGERFTFATAPGESVEIKSE